MISECCGAEDIPIAGLISDFGKCSVCGEECIFISEEEFGNEYAKEQIENALTGDE